MRSAAEHRSPPKVRVLIDECCDQEIARRLSRAGWDVAYVAAGNAGIEDIAVADMAEGRGRLLLTQDYDFGELVVRYGRLSSGLVLIGCQTLGRTERVERAVAVLLEEGERLAGTFTIIELDRVRRRKLGER